MLSSSAIQVDGIMIASLINGPWMTRILSPPDELLPLIMFARVIVGCINALFEEKLIIGKLWPSNPHSPTSRKVSELLAYLILVSFVKVLRKFLAIKQWKAPLNFPFAFTSKCARTYIWIDCFKNLWQLLLCPFNDDIVKLEQAYCLKIYWRPWYYKRISTSFLPS